MIIFIGVCVRYFAEEKHTGRGDTRVDDVDGKN